MRNKIVVLGQKDAIDLCVTASTIKDNDIYLVGEKHRYKVSAKSIMGVMLAVSEWGDDIWIESEGDYYSDFEKWIELAAYDAAFIHN